MSLRPPDAADRGRSCGTDRIRFLVLSVMVLAGCASIPAAYRGPTRTYESHCIDQLAVDGFRRKDYREGPEFSSIAAAQLGLPGTSGGTGITNDAAMLRYFLEDTHCFRVVDDQNTGSLRIEGSAEGQHGVGGLGFTVGMLEAVLLLPVLGIPVPDGAQGVATCRLYRDGHFVKSYEAVARMSFPTSLYTFIRDERRAVMLVRGMALRSLADRVAADLCRSQ